MKGCAIVLLGALAFVAGCELLGCTEMGCGPNLLVEVEGVEVGEDSEMTLRVEGEAPVRLFCFDNVCEPNVTYRERPDEFSVTLELPDTTITRSFDVNYRTSYPNGRACGPECRSARVTFSVD